MTNSFGARQTLTTGKVDRDIFRLDSAGGQFDSLPFTLKVLLENLLRYEDGENVTATDIGASNGVIHVIDAVILPGAATAVESGTWGNAKQSVK